jgi:hypothetical protein
MLTETLGRPATAVAEGTDAEGKPTDAETPTESFGRSTEGNARLGTGKLRVTPDNDTGAPIDRPAEPAGSVFAGKEAGGNETEGRPSDTEAATDTAGTVADAPVEAPGPPPDAAELIGAGMETEGE